MRSTVYIFKRHNLGLIVTILLLAAVVACQGETPASPSLPTSSPSPTRTSRPTLQPAPSPKDASEPSKISTPQPTGTPYTSCGSIEEQAQEALADWLGISSEEIEVIEIEEVEWPDTSLGCPQPGMAYAQVIVPGWRFVMRVDDEVYEYHSGAGHGVLCDQEGHLTSLPPSPTGTPITVPSAPTPTLEDVCPLMPVFPHGIVCPTPRIPGH